MSIAVLPDRQAQQAEHNKPRVGFTHNCYTSPLGRLFQETIKYGMEKAIGAAWKPLVRYRANGDKKLFAEGLKNPDAVFRYDDELFSLINSVLKGTAKAYLTDNDARRKLEIVCQAIDMLLTLAFEDVYYRPLMKKSLSKLVVEIAKRPELLDLDEPELYVDCVFNDAANHIGTKSQRIMEFKRLYYERLREAANGTD